MPNDHANKTYGGVSHSLCIAYFCSLGHTVSVPMFDNARYDLIVDDGKTLFRVQCKTATGKQAYPRATLGKNAQKPFLPTDFDFLWVITHEHAYLIPSNEIPCTKGYLRSIVLSPKYNTFKVDMPMLKNTDPRRKSVSPILTEQEKQRIESLFLNGESYISVAKIMGLTEPQVQNYLYKHGIKRNHTVNETVESRISELYQLGKPIIDIVHDVGFSRGTITKVIRRLGLRRRPIVLKPEWKPRIIEMARAGKTPSEIARHLGLKRAQPIRSFLYRQKWLVNEQPTATS